VSTGVAFLLWITILRFLPAGTASLNMFAIPVIALVSSMIVFGERLTVAEWSGIACIGAGLVIISGNALRARRDVVPPTSEI
jgi:drug/metabolite transporter (DMT)-like permease